MSDLLGILDGLAHLPGPLEGRGPVRRGLDALMIVLAAAIAIAGGASLLVGSFGAGSLREFAEFAGSVLTLDLVAAICWYLAYLIGSLIAVGVDRLLASQ